MNPSGVLVLTCLLLVLPPALGDNSTASTPEPQPQPAECAPLLCPGLTPYYPATSCREIVLCNRFYPSGYYWVKIYNHDGQPMRPVRVHVLLHER